MSGFFSIANLLGLGREKKHYFFNFMDFNSVQIKMIHITHNKHEDKKALEMTFKLTKTQKAKKK